MQSSTQLAWGDIPKVPIHQATPSSSVWDRRHLLNVPAECPWVGLAWGRPLKQALDSIHEWRGVQTSRAGPLQAEKDRASAAGRVFSSLVHRPRLLGHSVSTVLAAQVPGSNPTSTSRWPCGGGQSSYPFFLTFLVYKMKMIIGTASQGSCEG